MKEGQFDMSDLITLGETMVCFSPDTVAPLRYVRNFHPRIAGAESNIAIGMAKLGHSALWISCLGDDEFGHYIKNMVRAEGVDTRGVSFSEKAPTGIMFKERTGGETRVTYYRQHSAASKMGPEDIREEFFKDSRILHITGITPLLSESCHAAVEKAIELANRYEIKISFDPNIRRKLWGDQDHSLLMRELCKKSNMIFCGLDEAETIYGESDPEKLFRCIFTDSRRTELVALKNGSQGAWVATRESQIFLDPFPCQCIDPIGAGDAFNAGFLSGVLERKNLKACGEMGAIAGALATESDGDIEGYPSRKKIDSVINTQEDYYR